MSKPQHPGEVQYFDGDKLVSTAKVSELSENAAFAPIDGGFTPVVRVVRVKTESGFIIQEFGPGGTVVRSTVQVRAS